MTDSKAKEPNGLIGRVVLSFFLMLWVLLCAAAFAFVIRVFGATTETLQWTTWPFVVLVLGVPALIFLVNGGMVFVDKLIHIEKRYREFDLTKLNEVVKTVADTSIAVNSLSTNISSFSKNLQGVKGDIGAIKKISLETSLISHEASSEGDENDKDKQARLERFWELYGKARKLFADALAKLDDPSEFSRAMRDQKDEALKKLEESDLISEATKRFIDQAIRDERRTKRNKREDLSEENVKKLEELEKAAADSRTLAR